MAARRFGSHLPKFARSRSSREIEEELVAFDGEIFPVAGAKGFLVPVQHFPEKISSKCLCSILQDREQAPAVQWIVPRRLHSGSIQKRGHPVHRHRVLRGDPARIHFVDALARLRLRKPRHHHQNRDCSAQENARGEHRAPAPDHLHDSPFSNVEILRISPSNMRQ
jgi:hypothetical protein